MRNSNFEAWFARRTRLPLSDVQQMWTGKTYESHSYFVEIAWEAWCSALGFIPSASPEDEEGDAA